MNEQPSQCGHAGSRRAYRATRRRIRTAILVAAALGGGLTLLPETAHAAGLYFSDRGVRGLGRGGALVAGSDDAGSIYYNPAGLAFTGHQFLFDASWLNYSGTYQRKSRVEQTDPNTGEPTGQSFTRTFATVEGTSPLLPIPTLVYANPLGTKQFNFALGMWAPYAAITSYPETVGGAPAPQRYSLISLDGSALAIVGAYASWRPVDELALGAGIEMLSGFFETSVAFSACVPDRFICAPEQPDYDAISKLKVGPIFAPSGVLGATIVPHDDVRLGVAYHLPFVVNSGATVDVRLPSAPVFENASQSGNDATVKFTLPGVLRTGIEYRGIPDTRVEIAYVWENWAVHDRITIEPENIALKNVEAFPDEYKVSDISLDRNFQNTWSLRLGGEHTLDIGDYPFDIRAGISYEKSAIPNPYLSATTVDVDKITVGLGGGLHIGKWRFDGVIARVFGTTVDVDVDEARIAQVLPLRANPPDRKNYINAGRYEASALVLGIGLTYQFDSTKEPPSKPPEGGGTFRLKPKPGIQPDVDPDQKPRSDGDSDERPQPDVEDLDEEE